MTGYIHKLIYTALILILSNNGINANAEVTKRLLCDKKTIISIIDSGIEQNTKRINGLKSILQGTYTGRFQASEYFPIDINNEKQLNDYRDRLKNLAPPVFDELYPQCASEKEKFTASFSQLQKLKEAVTRLELQFLSLPKEQRQTIIRLSAESTQSNKILTQLKEEQQKVLIEHYESLVTANAVKEKIPTVENETEREFLNEIITIENIRSRLVFRIIQVLQANEKIYLRFQDYSEILSSSLSSLQKDLTSSALIVKYSEVNGLWSKIIDIGLKSGDLLQIEGEIVDIRIPEKKQPAGLSMGSEVYRIYNDSYRKLETLNDKLNSIYTVKRQNLIETHYKLIRDASSIRSKYLLQLKKSDEFSMVRFDREFFHDIQREILIVPYRLYVFAMTRWIGFRSRIDKGFSGIIELLKTVFLILLLIGAPFILFALIKMVSGKIENFRHELMQVRKPTALRLRINLFLKSVNPYMPYLLSYLLIKFMYVLLENSYFRELVSLLPYFTMFIIYRVFMILFKTNLKKIMFRSSLYTVIKYEDKIHTSARVIGIYFLVVFIMLHVTETSVGQAYIYFIVERVLYYMSFLVILITAYNWNAEISVAVENNFKSRLFIGLAGFSKGLPGIILSLPLLSIVAVKKIYHYISGRIFEFEFARKTIARLLRKQMEAAGAKVQSTDIDTIPDDYKKLFSMGVPKYDDIWVYPHTEDLDDSMSVINKWIKGETEEISLAIYGEKGMGKSSLLELISKKISEDKNDIKIIKETVTPKLTGAKETMAFFEKVLNTELKGEIDTLMDWDSSAGRHILMLDDAHNFFIARVGGFEGFQIFLKIINLRLKNLFICATFNIHSWIYLEGVFTRNRYFRSIVEMNPWREEDIKELIISRNKKGEVKLKYDRVISASLLSSEIESLENIEKRFFRLLWEQSEGNPRAAIYMWLTCVKPGNNYFNVGLPHDPEINIFSDIHNDALFVYASIAKHENITAQELIETTNLPGGMLEYAVKIGMEREFLYRSDKGRYRINPSYHNLVINYLMQRNLLYVN